MRQVKTGSDHGNWKGHGQIPRDYWNNLQRACMMKENRVWEITIEFADALLTAQNNLCALSGTPIHLGGRGDRTASLDRIDSTKGYTEDNVQWIHKDINTLKSNFPEERFFELCNAVSKHKEKTKELRGRRPWNDVVS